MKALYFLAALFLFGCEEEKRVVETKSTGDYQVSLLFEVDGCKVYRFGDKGYWRYFVNCGTNGQTETTEHCGKSCNRPVEVPSTWGK